jgi:3-hydroxyisobutyrate dehydrogenase-like beta-hydroxyacid dehydrogenase
LRAPSVVGVIGLGVMGRPMAAHIVAKRPGVTVRVWARRQEVAQQLVASGAEWHDTPASLAEGADLIILVLPDLPEVEALLYREDGILAGSRSELTLVICSTSSPTGVRALAERLHTDSHGRIRVVDAPVSGGEEGAVDGTLSIMVGGDAGAVAAASTVLTACGRPVHLGPLGAGQVAKACNQMIVAATVLALGEAAVLADRSGIDVGELFDLLAGGYAASRILQTRGPRIVAEDYAPSGVAKYLLKDLRYAADVAEHTGTHTALLPALKSTFDDLVASGFGEDDMAVTRRYIEERSRPPAPDV